MHYSCWGRCAVLFFGLYLLPVTLPQLIHIFFFSSTLLLASHLRIFFTGPHLVMIILTSVFSMILPLITVYPHGIHSVLSVIFVRVHSIVWKCSPFISSPIFFSIFCGFLYQHLWKVLFTKFLSAFFILRLKQYCFGITLILVMYSFSLIRVLVLYL